MGSGLDMGHLLKNNAIIHMFENAGTDNSKIINKPNRKMPHVKDLTPIS